MIITGASSGLGKCTALHLSFVGAILFLGTCRMGRLQMFVAQFEKQGGKAVFVATDVTVKSR
ncbi:SDR family NAD(P)-dependent oxidoreductase [Kosakonia sp. S42]|uniref:SDR family NAD(P)-dependent oxidoreductase n=1 Tax=Kosakonia sp. S42 TaxID=2767458 RepID=UPI0035C7D0E6